MIKFVTIRNSTKEVNVFDSFTKALEHTQKLVFGDRYFIYENNTLLATGLIKKEEEFNYEMMVPSQLLGKLKKD